MTDDRDGEIAELREREARYRSIFEAAGDAVVITDAHAIIVEVNPAACAAYGYSREELIGLNARALIHPDYHDAIDEAVAGLGGPGGGQRSVSLRTVALRKDGTTFVSEGYATWLAHRDGHYLLTVGRDVTDRVTAEERLQEKEEMLERRVQERTQELRTLLDVSQSVGSTLDLQPLLKLILDQLNLVVENDGAGLLMLEGDDLVVLVRRTPGTGDAAFPERYTVASHGALWDPLNRGEPVIVDNVRGDTPMARTYQEVVGPYLDTAFSFERSFMAVPMMLKDRLIGLLSVSSSRMGYYTPHHADLALALAQQAAIAIENARLYEKAQALAALEERQRLARELHDSVTQALFGINVAAHTARVQLDRDPQAAAGSIEYLRSLAQGGMAEMRALLFELRPESLETEGLAAALQKVAQALTARHEIPIELTLCDEPQTPLPVKEALYRIAQEALNNTFKHARPTRVAVRLFCSEDEIVLEVEDDGMGFDTAAEYPGHLGLHSMEERALRLGGSLDVRSVPGRGTRVRACIPI